MADNKKRSKRDAARRAAVVTSDDLPPNWRLVNCSKCGLLLSGPSMARIVSTYRPGAVPPLVAGSSEGRPCCQRCLGSEPKDDQTESGDTP